MLHETLAFRISVRWPIYIINSVDKTKFLYTTSPPTQHHSFSRNYPFIHLLSLVRFYDVYYSIRLFFRQFIIEEMFFFFQWRLSDARKKSENSFIGIEMHACAWGIIARAMKDVMTICIFWWLNTVNSSDALPLRYRRLVWT